MATADDPFVVMFAGPPPAGAHPEALARMGKFVKAAQQVNGHPCYQHADRDDVMMWWVKDSRCTWLIGLRRTIGTHFGQVYVVDDASIPHNIKPTSKWMIANSMLHFINANVKIVVQPGGPPAAASYDADVSITGVRTREERDAEGRKRAIDLDSDASRKAAKTALDTRVAEAKSRCSADDEAQYRKLIQPAVDDFLADNKAAIASAEAALDKERDDECVVVGERTREQKDAEGRKRAIDLDEETPRKRAKQLEDVHTRITKGRSVCTAAVDGRYRELLQPAIEAFASDEIDEAELGKRKKAAREQAEAGHGPLGKLNRAAAAWSAAVEVRVAAEAALASTIATEDEAEAALEEALREVEAGGAGGAAAGGGGAGPSRVKKEAYM